MRVNAFFEADTVFSNLESDQAKPTERPPGAYALIASDDFDLIDVARNALQPCLDLEVFDERFDSLPEETEGLGVVIVDERSYQRGGLRLLEDFREHVPNVPVLFVTGFGDLETARRAIVAGASEYLPKPLEPQNLQQIVASLIPGIRFGSGGQGLSTKFARPVVRKETEEENYLRAHIRGQQEFLARVIRYSSKAIVVEAGLDSAVGVGTILKGTEVTLGFRSVSIADAVVAKVTNLADRRWIEVGLGGDWEIGNKPSSDSSGLDQAQPFVLPTDIRSSVIAFEDLLDDLHDDLAPFEDLMLEIGPDERPDMEAKILSYAESRFFPNLTEALTKFEQIAESIDSIEGRRALRRIAQQRLFPMILCSPFVSRIVAQPIGVPGDFGILGQLLGDPYRGHSLYGRLLNAWLISSKPSEAYRQRISMLEGEIDQVVKSANSKGESANILSMASGVGFEVQRFVNKASRDSRASIDLVDFNQRTLIEAKRQFIECQKQNRELDVDVNLRQDSVFNLAKHLRRAAEGDQREEYDLVYCVGLFDYLSERMCSQVISYLYKRLKPGGKIIVSNYTPENEMRHFMGVVLDWELLHRTPDQFSNMLATTLASGRFEIRKDETHTELYAVAEK